MLNALSVSLSGDEAGRLRAARSFEQQGFVPAARFDWAGGALQAWGHPAQPDVPDCFVTSEAGTGCCIGPIWYRGRFGVQALTLLLAEIDEPSMIDETRLRGNFALFLHKRGRAWLLNDALGFVHLFRSGDGRFHSTSWLAARAYVGDAGVDETAAVQYVLQGASHSTQTVALGVTKLAPGHAIDLADGRVQSRFPMGIWAGAQTFTSPGAATRAIEAHLGAVFAEVVSAFPGRVSAALSGGFDSRLIVAGLLAHGERPRLFVYGNPASGDAPVAREVAQAEGLPIEVVDKEAMNRQLPAPDLAELVRSALFFDGLPNDGIDDPGADRRTRIEQTADGRIALNGGGGEIFRNFFHLPDRRYGAGDLVRAFYRGFDAGVFRGRGGLADYESAMADAIAQSVGLDAGEAGRLLAREQVEWVYPLFRCHHWMGVNNSVAVRHGHFATPLVDLESTRIACMLPLEWKNAGRFESGLIAALHRGIASGPSTYGFRFIDGPDLRARWNEWITCQRPAFVRPTINAVRRRLHGAGPSAALVARCRSLLPGEWRLDPLLDLSRLPDDAAFGRALAIEVVSRELAP